MLFRWQRTMVDLFPAVHRHLRYDAPDPFRLTYRWYPEERDDRRPVLLMAHYDVVPASPEGWTCDPFGGDIRDGAVWGRGAIDDKLSHIAILRAAEELLQEGFRPTRPFHFAFGGDEETGGRRGAAVIARSYAEEGVRFAMTLDEGAIVARGALAGLDAPVGLIGCGEKGHINVRLSVPGGGGHAATPTRFDASVALAEALRRLFAHPLPTRRTATVDSFVRTLGRYLPGARGLLLRVYPATAPAVRAVLSRTPETDAMLRTTRAVTMLSGSDAPNVLPRRVSATINLRLLPGQTIDETLALLRRRVRGRHRPVEIALAPGWDNNEAPSESPTDGPWYDLVRRSILNIWPDIPILPYLVTATTDSRHYAAVSDCTYRFLPFELSPDDLVGIHGVDEHIAIENIHRAVEFYRRFIVHCDEMRV